MTADPQPTLPDPRTANDDELIGDEAADGRSAAEPAEGADDAAAPNPGSPRS